MKLPIYLDYAAASPVDKTVLNSMMPYFTQDFYNPSASYGPAINVKNSLSEARKEIAFHLGAKQTEIIFTAGGTEANNLAISGVMKKNPGKNVLVSAIEHESVLSPAKQFIHKIVPVEKTGLVNQDNLFSLIDGETVLISIILASNEIGVIQPLKEISLKIKQIRSQRLLSGNLTPLYLHTDASQAPNYLDIHHSQIGADLITLNGGKIYGPKQTGVLFVSSRVVLDPILLGGGQENNLRSGTENIPGFIGLATALDLAQTKRKEESYRLSQIQKHFFKNIKKAIPEAIINGNQSNRLPNNIHISIEGVDNERLILLLEKRGILVAAGSACSASKNEPSHILRAIGVSEELAKSSIRITMGRDTSKEDIDYLLKTLVELVRVIKND